MAGIVGIDGWRRFRQRAFERDLAAVERDLNRGYVTRATAETRYGVVVTDAVTLAAGHTRYRLDAAASAARRAQLQAQPIAA